jgi:hypothetical protein
MSTSQREKRARVKESQELERNDKETREKKSHREFLMWRAEFSCGGRG